MALHAMAVKRKDVTYLNISPAAHTRRGVEALGFKQFCTGQIVFAPILSARRPGVRVVAFAADAPEAALLPESERAILADMRRSGAARWSASRTASPIPSLCNDGRRFIAWFPASS